MLLSPLSIDHIKALIQQADPLLKQRRNVRLSVIPESGEIRYYSQEIFRHWNRINFIYQRLTRAFPACKGIDATLAKIVIYQKKWERTENSELTREIISFYQNGKQKPPKNPVIDRYLLLIHQFNWTKVYRSKSPEEQLSLETSTPTFIIQRLKSVMDFTFLSDNLTAMYDAPKNRRIWVRLNTLRIPPNESTDSILHNLQSHGISLSADPLGHNLFTIPMTLRNKLLQFDYYKQGCLILHDKASMYPPLLLDPQPFEMIADLCAAPGIKAGIIAQSSQNTTRLIISDFHPSRIGETDRLLHQWGVANHHCMNVDSIAFPSRQDEIFDKVLLDAPCTGSGTFLSNPELKIYQNTGFLEQNRVLQAKLLQSALRLLKPGGILVYSTCSLYPDEGEQQIIKIMDNMEPCTLPSEISPSYLINNNPIPGTGRLFPAIQGTQGFFLAKLRKKKVI